MTAAGHGNLDSIHDFLKSNAKVSLKSKNGWTALDFAQKQNRNDAVSYLQDVLKRQTFTNPGTFNRYWRISTNPDTSKKNIPF